MALAHCEICHLFLAEHESCPHIPPIERQCAPTGSADAVHPLAMASARTLSNARPSVREDGCAGEGSILSPDLSGALISPRHNNGVAHGPASFPQETPSVFRK